MINFKNFMNEDITVKTDNIYHHMNRVKKTIKLLQKVKNEYILYRNISGYNLQGEKWNLLWKVTNNRGDYDVRLSRHREDTIELLKELGIKKPVFMTNNISSANMFGSPTMVVPPEKFKLYYNENIKDLGWIDLEKETEGEDLDTRILKNFIKTDSKKLSDKEKNEKIKQIVSGYKKGFPNKKMYEVIMECDYYYMINVRSFARHFVGKKIKSNLTANDKKFILDTDKYSEKFKKYKDIIWFLENVVMGYLEWLEKSE